MRRRTWPKRGPPRCSWRSLPVRSPDVVDRELSGNEIFCFHLSFDETESEIDWVSTRTITECIYFPTRAAAIRALALVVQCHSTAHLADGIGVLPDTERLRIFPLPYFHKKQ